MIHPLLPALLVLAVAGPARAAARPAVLTWDAPAGCPTADQVLDDVERTLAMRRVTPPLVTAAAHVLAAPDGTWQAGLAVQVGATRTERRFQAESCTAIAAVVALIVAIAVDDAPEAVSAPSPPAGLGGEARPVLKIQPILSRPTRFFATLSALVDWDTMPSPPAGGLELAGGRKWNLGRWRLGGVVAAEYFPNHRPASAPYLGQVSGAFWMLGLSARGCGGLALSRLEIGPCVGGELVGMHASAASDDGTPGFITVQNQTRYWLSFLGSLVASWNLSPTMDLVLRADLVVPTARKVFDLQSTALWDFVESAAAARAGLGLAYRFQ